MPKALYFYTPMAILVVCNLFLFLARQDTAVLRCETSSRHSQHENSNSRLHLFFKLFLIMGISWMSEWVSFMLGGSQDYWIITDLFNTLSRVAIFIMFVCTRRAKNLIFQRFNCTINESTSTKVSTSGIQLSFGRLSQISESIPMPQSDTNV